MIIQAEHAELPAPDTQMKYFRLMRSGVDVAALLDEVLGQEEAWLLQTSRQERIPVQRHTNTIFLCNATMRPDLHINENQECGLTDIAGLFPKAVAFLGDFAQSRDATLSRATIVRLKPRTQVYPHVDAGAYYFIRDRYHLVLQSKAGSILCSGNEYVRMQEGELWWFDNKQYHAAFNESDEWRIHYIFDLLPNSYKHLAVNPTHPQGLVDALNQYRKGCEDVSVATPAAI